MRSRRDWQRIFVATNAYLAANSNLGRLLSGTTAATQNTTLQIANPDALYLDRDNQIDFRVGKVLKWRGMRSTVNLDLYNLTNASTIFTANQAYALTGNVWLTPNLNQQSAADEGQLHVGPQVETRVSITLSVMDR